jgi:hypothetical protein
MIVKTEAVEAEVLPSGGASVYSINTPAGFALLLINELWRKERISMADRQVLERVVLPVAEQEKKQLARAAGT